MNDSQTPDAPPTAFDPTRPLAVYSTKWCAMPTSEETSNAVSSQMAANANAPTVVLGQSVAYDDHGDARESVVVGFDGDRIIVEFSFMGHNYTMRAMSCEVRPL